MGTGRDHFAALSWPVRTTRTRLRPVVPTDRDAVHAYRSREHVTTFLGRGPMAPAEVDERIEENLARSLPGHPHPLLGLVVEVDGEVVGDCMIRLEPDDGLRSTFIGYTLHPDHKGQGLATEVAEALVRLSFAELGVAMVQADVFAPHLASQRVLEKVGMRRIRTTPAGGEGGGHPRTDDHLYAVTAAEWAGSPSSWGPLVRASSPGAPDALDGPVA